MKKKILITGVMGSLTFLASNGFRWQYSKYKISKERWGKIDNILEKFNPIPLQSITIPSSSEFILIEVQGKPLPNIEFFPLMKENREGYQVFQLYQTSTNGIWVNNGWIPKDLKEEIYEKIKNSLPVEIFV